VPFAVDAVRVSSSGEVIKGGEFGMRDFATSFIIGEGIEGRTR